MDNPPFLDVFFQNYKCKMLPSSTITCSPHAKSAEGNLRMNLRNEKISLAHLGANFCTDVPLENPKKSLDSPGEVTLGIQLSGCQIDPTTTTRSPENVMKNRSNKWTSGENR